MILFKLTLLTIWVRKTWFIILMAMLVLPFVGPYIAPVEEVPKLMQPARAHTAWMLAWMIGILWGLSQGAKSGDGNARTGVVTVNLPTAGTDYHVPFGGRGDSSYGPREQGRTAAEFYTTVKTAYINAGEPL